MQAPRLRIVEKAHKDDANRIRATEQAQWEQLLEHQVCVPQGGRRLCAPGHVPRVLLSNSASPGEGGGSLTPLCDIPSGCRFFMGPWTVTRSSLRMLRRVAAFCRPLRPVLPLVSFPRSRSPVVGVPGLCGMCRLCVSGAQ